MTKMRSLSDPIIAKATCLEMSKTRIMNSLASFSLLMLTLVILSSISLSLMTAVPYADASTVSFAGNTEGITKNAVDDSKMIIVTLNGSSSTDPDGTITSYRWEQTAGSPTVTLSDPSAVNPTFRVPASMLMGTIDADTTLAFRLTVTDNNGASDSSDVNVVLKRSPLKDERETSSLSLPDNSGTNVTSASALDNATATNQEALASPLSAVSPVLPQNTTLSLSPSSFDSDSGSNTYSKQLQLLGQGLQNKSSSSASTSVLDNDGDRNLTKSSDELLESNWNMTAVQGTEQPFQLFRQQHPFSPQQLFEDGRGQRGQEAGPLQQLQQKQDSQGLPFSSSSPAAGLIALGGGVMGLGAIENGTEAPTNELSYPLQVFPPPVLPTTPGAEPLLAPSQHLLPPTTLAEPLYSSATNPPDTFITSAIDNSTELNIQNGPITTSTSGSITLTFSGTDDLGINGYSCSVDGLAAFTCSSPIVLDSNIFQTIQFGSITNTIHTFQVSAIDSSGTMDPTPAIFNWIMTDPSSTDIAPSESLALAPVPSAGSLAIPILPPQQPDTPQPLIEQQQQQLQQQQIHSQTAVPEHLAPDTILPPNPFEYQHVPPGITIPSIQAPFVPLQ